MWVSTYFIPQLAITLICFIPIAIANGNLRLKPISDPSDLIPGHRKRDLPSGIDAFAPQNQFTFYLGAEFPRVAKSQTEVWIGNFTLFKPEGNSSILPIEAFAKSLKSVVCNETSITIAFNSKQDYDHASKLWDWVNGNADRDFTLITGPNDCDANDSRDPYLVTDIVFKTDPLGAVLNSTHITWEAAAADFDFSTRMTVLNDTKTKQVKRQMDANIGNESFNQTQLDEKLDKIEDLAKKLEALSADTSDGSSSVEQLQEEVDTVMNDATTAADNAIIAVLERIIKDRSDDRLVKLASKAVELYKEQMDAAEKKYNEAEAATDDIDKTSKTTEALNLEEKAAEALFSPLDTIIKTMGGSSSDTSTTQAIQTRSFKRLDRRWSLSSTAQSWWKAITGTWEALKKVVKVAVEIYNIISGDGPFSLSWDVSWTPQLYKTPAADVLRNGIKLSADAIASASGTISGEVDLGFRDRKLFQYNVKLAAEEVQASIELALATSGTLKNPLDFETRSFDIPLGSLQGQKIEAFGNSIITIGPFLSISLRASLPAMKGQGSMRWGAKAVVPSDARLVLSADESVSNDVTGWTPKFSLIGPTLNSSNLEGQFSIAVVLATTVEATVFGKGANVSLEAVPSASIAIRPQACSEKDKIKGIGIRPYLGFQLNTKSAASIDIGTLKPSSAKKNIYKKDFGLLKDDDSICFPSHSYQGDVGDTGDNNQSNNDDLPPPYTDKDPWNVKKEDIQLDDNEPLPPNTEVDSPDIKNSVSSG